MRFGFKKRILCPFFAKYSNVSLLVLQLSSNFSIERLSLVSNLLLDSLTFASSRKEKRYLKLFLRLLFPFRLA